MIIETAIATSSEFISPLKVMAPIGKNTEMTVTITNRKRDFEVESERYLPAMSSISIIAPNGMGVISHAKIVCSAITTTEKHIEKILNKYINEANAYSNVFGYNFDLNLAIISSQW